MQVANGYRVGEKSVSKPNLVEIAADGKQGCSSGDPGRI